MTLMSEYIKFCRYIAIYNIHVPATMCNYMFPDQDRLQKYFCKYYRVLPLASTHMYHFSILTIHSHLTKSPKKHGTNFGNTHNAMTQDLENILLQHSSVRMQAKIYANIMEGIYIRCPNCKHYYITVACIDDV